MRWQRASAAVVALALVVALPAVGQGGWLTLTSGSGGAVEPFATAELFFDFPGGTPVVAVNQLSGTGTIQAKAGGATTHFGGLGVPVLLNLSDGTAYLAGGSPPPWAIARGPSGVTPGGAASTAPATGADVPSTAILLGVSSFEQPLSVFNPVERSLTVVATTGSGTVLGGISIDIPLGGWWVAGLGPDAQPVSMPVPTPTPTPEPTPDPTPEPGPLDPPGDIPTPTPSPDPGTVPGVPEPTTLALGLIGAAAVSWRRVPAGR